MAAVPCARHSLQIQMSGLRSSFVLAAIAERIVSRHATRFLIFEFINMPTMQQPVDCCPLFREVRRLAVFHAASIFKCLPRYFISCHKSSSRLVAWPAQSPYFFRAFTFWIQAFHSVVVCRPNKSPEPTTIGAFRDSARVAGCWMSIVRGGSAFFVRGHSSAP